MDNGQMHINQLGVDNPPPYTDPNFPYQGMAGYPSAQVVGGHATITGHLDGKIQLDPQDMLPYSFQATDRAMDARRTQHPAPLERQTNAGPQAAELQSGRDLEMTNAGSSVPQRSEQNFIDKEQQMDVQIRPQRDSEDDTRAMRDGSQLAEARYDEFGMNNPSAPDGAEHGIGQKGDDKSGTPAWTELKTKAGKERKRLPLACIACRRKKIRCSGEKPACKHCLRSRIPCVYKVTTRKAAPRTDYMAMLDKRLKRMEERIIKIIPKEEQEQTSVVRAQVKPALPGTAAPGKPSSKKRAAEQAFNSGLESWAQSSGPTNQGLVPASLMAQEREEENLLREGADALPPLEVQEHLANVFFDNLYGQAYHVLHKPSYMKKLKAGKLPPVLILAVCAVSARFATHISVVKGSGPAFLRGEAWASEARRVVLNRYEWPNITILTCLLLLGLHEFGTCYGGRSWAFGGMAIRMAYALQLHRDLDYDPCKQNTRLQLSFVDREIRRRTMWACFLMDRFNSSGTDRPMFIKEETIRVQLPIREELFQLGIEGPTEDMDGNVPYPSSGADGELQDARDNMGVAAFMIKSIALWGRIIIYHFQGGRERDSHQIWEAESEFANLRRQSEDFVASLPDSLKFSEQNLQAHVNKKLANQFIFLHISGQQNMLLLNHNATSPLRSRLSRSQPRPDPPRDFLMKTSQAAFEAAKKVSDLLLAAEEVALTAPFAGYCAFLSSSVQMTAAFSKDEAVSSIAKKNLTTNVRYLTKVKKYWGAFHWTSEQLKNQYLACADAATRGQQGLGAAPAGSTSAAITMYGDWFDRYPHGVSQNDFEDPAIQIKQEKGDDAVLEHKSDLQSMEQFFRTIPLAAVVDGKGNGKKRKVAPAAKGANGPAGTNVQTVPSPLAGQPLSTPSPAGYMQEQQQQQQQHLPIGHQHNPLQVPEQHHQMQQQHQPVGQGYASHLSPNFIPPAHQHSLSPHHPHSQQHQHTQQQAQQPYYPTANDFSYPAHQMGLGLGIMPQLDRQLVYGAYNSSGLEMRGIDMTAAMHGDPMTWDASPHQGHHPNPHHPASGVGDGGNGAHWQTPEQPTSAWFMPFNMQPPPDMGSESDGFALGLGAENGNGGYGMEMGMNMGMDMGLGGQQGGPQRDGSMGGSNHGT